MKGDTEIERLLAEWQERGGSGDTEEFLAAHPEHAEALRRHLDVLDLVGSAFEPRAALPESLGPFRIEEELGSGGMGTVYRAVVASPARGLAAGRTVALKVVHPHLFRTAGFFKRFLREAELGRRIDHPNVVRTLDADAVEVDGRPQHYLVMDYVEGQTLRDLVDDVDRVPEELARHIGGEVAKALSAIHAAGAVHRDLKPENVLITRDHEVKVMDLGVAWLADEQVRLSQTGAFVGSLHYAAPEQFRGGSGVDARADLHGLGLLLHEISTGVHPFADEDARVVMRRILSDAPRKVGELNPQLSPFFEEVVHRLLLKDPAARFQSADELVAVLDAAEASAWWHERALALRAETRRPLRRIRVPRETAVYGRDAEIEQLRRLYDEAKAGDGRVVLVEGEAGIGKTRLVDEFVARLQQAGEDVHFLFASYPPGGAATGSGAFSAAYREHLGADGLEETLRRMLPQTPVLVPTFAALLTGDAPPRDAEPLTKDSLQTCFVHLTRNLAAERTTIVLIDDLHFAPEEGRALFTSVALAVPGHRVLLVGTMRPGVPEDWTAGVTRLAQTTHVTVPRLSPRDLVRLLGDSFRSERLAEELAGKIAVKSDGNPFFVFEIVRGLREGQFITQREDGSWHTTRLIEEIQVPSSVLDLVNARVADLEDEDRNLLDVAACWGYEFDPSLVAAALRRPRLPVLQRLARIEKRDRLVRARGRLFAFDHHQVQEALYGALPEMLREEYHAALATALEARTGAAGKEPATLDGGVCVELCEHFLRGAQGERALRYLDSALTHLEKGYLNEKVFSLADRALSTPGLLNGVQRVDVLVRKSDRLKLLGRPAPERAALEEAMALAESVGSPALRGRVELSFGEHLRSAASSAQAAEVFVRAMQHAEEGGDRRLAIRAAGRLGLVLKDLSRHQEACGLIRRGLEWARASEDTDVEAACTVNLGSVSLVQGRFDEAGALIERGLDLARCCGNRRWEAVATSLLGIVGAHQGRCDEAREYFERSLVLNLEIGNRGGEAANIGNLAGVFASKSRLADAQEHSERHLALSREIGDREGEAYGLVSLGTTWLTLGDRSRARRALDPSIALCREIGSRCVEGYGLLGLGALADEEGDTAEALRLTEESLTLRREIGHGDGVADSLLELGDLRRRAGDGEAARAALEEALSLSREQGRRPQVALALALLACLPGGDAGAAEAAHGETGEAGDSARVRWLLFHATGNRKHLVEAKRLLDFLVEHAPPECRESMLTNVRLHREIVEAWSAHGSP